MKPTWGIRKLNEYSISKDTAIIITDSEKITIIGPIFLMDRY